MFGFIKKILNKDDQEQCLCDFECGDTILIRPDEESTITWETNICKIKDNILTVRMPAPEAGSPFSHNQVIYGSLPRGEKTGKFSAVVVEVSTRMKQMYLEMNIPGELKWFLSRKRVHERIKLNVPVKVKNVKSRNKEWLNLRMIDFSVGGIGFVSQDAPNPGDKLEINLTSVDFPYVIRGVVKRVCKNEDRETFAFFKFRGGLEFIDLNSKDRERLESLFRSLKQTYR